MLGRGKETSSLSLSLDLLLTLPKALLLGINSSSSLVFMLPVPHSHLDMVISIPFWFRGGRASCVPLSAVQETQVQNGKLMRERKEKQEEGTPVLS